MLQGEEFNLGQMLRDADIFSVEDLERAIDEANRDTSIAEVVRKEATWSSFKQLLKTDLLAGAGGRKDGRALQEVLEKAGWVSAEQIGLVLEAIDQYGEGLGQRLLQEGLLTEEQLQTALERQNGQRRSLWRVLVNTGLVDLMQICDALKIEERLLGQMLVTQGHLDVKTLQDYLDKATHGHRPMARLLVDDGKIESKAVAECWCELYNLPLREIRHVAPPRELLTRFQPEQLSEHLIFPIQLDGGLLTVALGNPCHIAKLRGLWPAGATRIKPVVAPIDQILTKIREARERGVDDGSSAATLREQAAIDPDGSAAEIVDGVLREALANRGTDLHFDPGGDRFRIRLRVDGALHDLAIVGPEKGVEVVSRLKALANLDIADHRHAHDGQLVAHVGTELSEMRIATVPTRHGEKTVLKLLQPAEFSTGFAELGMTTDQVEQCQGLLRRPHGLLLCAGPVGCGKTTTLYSALDQMQDSRRSIVTLEDPVERELPGVNQIEIRDRGGLSLHDGLKAISRQDPDVVMLGEIRDVESARTAVRLSMSGVLVLSSIHANSAAGAIDALLSLEVSPHLVGNCLLATVAQRLVRRVCGDCAESYPPYPALLDELGITGIAAERVEFRRGRGCASCLGTGHRGMSAIFEVLPVDDPVRQLIRRQASEAELQDAAIRGGMQTIAQRARTRIKEGRTTPEEFLSQFNP